MGYCSNCGSEMADDMMVCANCGNVKEQVQEQVTGDETTVLTQPEPTYNAQPVYNQTPNYNGQPVYNAQPVYNQAPPMYNNGYPAYGVPYAAPPKKTSKWDKTPISMWGYFGYDILFAIPLVGFICLLIFALGGTRNINLRNYAQSKFCLLIIVIILCVIAMLFGGLSAAFMSSQSYY